jgi:hypothetical protein
MVKYTSSVGKKFDKKGNPIDFPGNTVICHIPKESPQFSFLVDFQTRLKASPFASHFAFLPPSSFHMTVFEGVCDRIRKPTNWTTKLPINAPLTASDELFTKEWNQIQKPKEFRVRPALFYAIGTLGFRYKPVNLAMSQSMRGFRDLLADKFGLRFPNHEKYAFHTTLGYQITSFSFLEGIQVISWMKKQQKYLHENYGILTTGEPEFTFFTDMTNFAPSRMEAKTKVHF